MEFQGKNYCGNCLIEKTFIPYYDNFEQELGIKDMVKRFSPNILVNLNDYIGHYPDKNKMIFAMTVS